MPRDTHGPRGRPLVAEVPAPARGSRQGGLKPLLLDVEEVAAVLGAGRTFVYELLKAPDRLPGNYRYRQPAPEARAF